MDDYLTKKIEMPTFALGDEVEFEVARGTNYGRWNYNNADHVNKDLGPSGIWAKGTIVHSSEVWPKDAQKADKYNAEWFYIKYEIDGSIGAGYTAFPKPCNAYYCRFQWDRSGYLRKIYAPKCTCGSDSIYGPSNSVHSYWCDKNKS